MDFRLFVTNMYIEIEKFWNRSDLSLISLGVRDFIKGSMGRALGAGRNITGEAGILLPAGEPGTDDTHPMDNIASTVSNGTTAMVMVNGT